jgi:hypothetical protein
MAGLDLSNFLVLVPVIVGSALIVALGVGFFTRGPSWTWFAALFIGAGLCGSSVFASLSWNTTSGKIETIAGISKESGDLAKKNSEDIAIINESLKAVNSRVDALAQLVAQNKPAGGPGVGEWQSTLDSLTKGGEAAQVGIGKLDKSTEDKQSIVKRLQLQLDKM